MSAASATLPTFAKKRTEDVVGNRHRALRLNSALMQKSRSLFSLKTAHHLHEITGYSLRSCEAWLSERVVIPAGALAALLQSEWGRDFLAAVMTDNTPRWWLQLKAWISAVDYAAMEIKQRRKLRELLNDAAQSPGAAALLVQDEDFYRGQPDPRQAMVRKPRR